jgi:hypothetical protein
MSQTLHPSLLIKISSSKFGHQIALHKYEHAFYIRNTYANIGYLRESGMIQQSYPDLSAKMGDHSHI